MAGWSDGNKDAHVCKACKKPLHLSLSELLIFPQAEADTDLFQFSYVVPPHKAGGAFSTEICKGSDVRVVRNYGLPTYVKTMKRSEAPTIEQGQREMPAVAAPTPSTPKEEEEKQDVKKKVEALSPKKAEERYNYLLSRQISELTDAEYAERLALLERLTAKQEPKQE